jgi:hypothetical protein
MRKIDVIRTDMAHVWASLSDEPRDMLHCHTEYEIFYMIQGDFERFLFHLPASFVCRSITANNDLPVLSRRA